MADKTPRKMLTNKRKTCVRGYYEISQTYKSLILLKKSKGLLNDVQQEYICLAIYTK